MYIGKDGISGRAFNNKAQISHEVAPKDTLSKRSDGVISNKYVRTVGGNAEQPRSASNMSAQTGNHGKNSARTVRTENKANTVSGMDKSRGSLSTEAQKRAHYESRPNQFSELENKSVKVAGEKNTGISAGAPPQNTARITAEQKREHYAAKSLRTSSNNYGTDSLSLSKSESYSVKAGAPRIDTARIAAEQKREHYAARSLQTSSNKHRIVSPESDEQPAGNSSIGLQMPDARKRAHLAKKMLNVAPSGKYKILKNGAIGKTKLTKRKIRVIGSKVVAKLQKAKLKKLRKQTVWYNREQAQLAAFAMGGAAAVKKADVSKAVGGAKKAVNLAKKPVDVLKQQFYSQADKSDDDGIKAAKLGMQIKDYGAGGLKTAVRTGAKTVKNGSKIAKRVYHKIHKPTSAELRRKLQKRVNHNLVAEAKYLTKRAVKTGVKTAGKAAANAAKATAKASAKAAARAAQAAAKAAAAAAKAAAGAVAKIAGLIAETSPWSLIIIAVIVIIILIVLMFGSFLSGAGGSVAGGGEWLIDDSNSQTPEEMYERYKEFIEQAKDVMETQTKDALQSDVSDFCNSDTSKPRKIIQYVDKSNDLTFFPARGADGTINAIIEPFGADDYADYMSLLFVLMTREKQQADGVTDGEIYEFDFKKSDFEEFMKTVNENSCRWGDTFVYKTAVETSPHACPGQNCETEYIPGCHCDFYIDDEGEYHYFCAGHPYCPVNHTKLTVELFTIKDYYGKEYSEIYDFTENEKIRYEAAKAIIQGLLEYFD